MKKLFKKHILLCILTITFSCIMLFIGELGNFFGANIMSQQIKFDGTTYPIKKVPNWLTWGGDNHVTLFSSIPSNKLIEIPKYETSVLKTPVSSLKWGDSKDDKIRISKLTYSVVYLGNYEMDGIEENGSHPAVDIRVPKGTPVYAIANGIVTDVQHKTTGFGHYIVIKHPDVPDYPQSSSKTNLYSSYSHLSKTLVNKGDIIKKGEKIGEVGDTGTATTLIYISK